jgi:hypothetical protein
LDLNKFTENLNIECYAFYCFSESDAFSGAVASDVGAVSGTSAGDAFFSTGGGDFVIIDSSVPWLVR